MECPSFFELRVHVGDPFRVSIGDEHPIMIDPTDLESMSTDSRPGKPAGESRNFLSRHKWAFLILAVVALAAILWLMFSGPAEVPFVYDAF